MSLTLTPDGDGRYPVRVWSADSYTGELLGELHPRSGSSWSVELGGGQCSAIVDLGMRLRDNTDWDYAAAATVRGLVAPGKRTLVVTQSTACLGEWLITRLDPTGETTVQLTGEGWERYPNRRDLRARYKWAAGLDQMAAARTLLADAMAGITLTVPVPAASGVLITADDRFDAWSTSYGAALDQLCDTDDGLEWAVLTTTPASSGGVPVGSVLRTVVWGYPELRRTTTLTARRYAPQGRGGNVASLNRAVDLDRLVTRAMVLGRGTGSKQVKGSYTQEALLAAGYLPAEKAFTEPTIKKAATAARRAKRHTTGTESELLVPGPVELLLADSEGWPQPGDLIGVSIARTPAEPAGVSGTLRAGAVSWTVTAGAVSTVTVEGVDQ